MQNKQIVLFEDSAARSDMFAPSNTTRAIAELRRGCQTPIEAFSGYDLVVHTTAALAPVLGERYPSVRINAVNPCVETYLINARASDPAAVLNELIASQKEHLHLGAGDGTVVGAKTMKGLPDKKCAIITAGEPFDLPTTEPTTLDNFTSLWDMVIRNDRTLTNDIRRLTASSTPHQTANGSVYFRDIDRHYPNVVFDTTKGAILIGENVTIEPFVLIKGPAYIGDGTLIKSGTRIYSGTTIGPVSKVGGEIEHSIIAGYSNKQHDGYLGHSYIGQWCNLGAGTNTSDLRNDYGTISLKIAENTFDTGAMFIGLLMGDHSKSAIGTQFNTGSVIGAFCNVFSEGFPARWLPNFSWGGGKVLRKQSIDKVLETVRIVMSRRGVELGKAEEIFIRSL
jgi:UDP-N-acetylglucosamine diphosphorylase/glucosamine-1-phosphate N-acetyltransferase